MYLIRLLGGISIEGPDDPLAGKAGQRHPTALLALLAATPDDRPLSRDKLLAYLWPEKDVGRARNLLNQAIHALRQALGPHAIRSVGSYLTLDPEVVCSDVQRFEEALDAGDPEGAVEFYRGPFLDGFFLDDASEFERWVEATRGRLARSQADALRSLAQRAAARGDFPRACELLRRLSAREPYNANATIALMRALESAGDRGAAIREAESHVARLARDLDAKPDPAVIELADRMRRAPQLSPLSASAWTDTGRAGCGGESSGQIGHTARDEPATADRAVRARASRGLSSRRFLAASAIVAGMLIALAAARVVIDMFGASGEIDAAHPSIAVLPIANLGPDADGRYYADGIHDELISRLTSIGSIETRSRASVLEHTQPADLPAVARQLDVGFLVTTTLRKAADRLVITARLFEAGTGRTVWTERYEKEIGDVFAIQRDLALRIADELDARLTASERERVANVLTGNEEAWKEFSRAKLAMAWIGDHPPDNEAAERYLSRAIELDSAFAPAYAWRSVRQAHTYWWGDRTREQLERARQSAETALWLDPNLADAHFALALVAYWGSQDYEDALERLRRAQELRPGDAEIQSWMGVVRRRMGDHEGAIAAFRTAIRTDPRLTNPRLDLARTLYLLRRSDELREAVDLWEEALGSSVRYWEVRRLRDLEGNVETAGALHDSLWNRLPHLRDQQAFWLQRYTQRMMEGDGASALEVLEGKPDLLTPSWAVWPVDELRGMAYRVLGDEDRAMASFEAARALLASQLERSHPEEDVRYRLAYARALAFLRERDAALRAAGSVFELATASPDRPLSAFSLSQLALVHAWAGELDDSLELLGRAFDARAYGITPAVIELDPVWAPLRDHPEFPHVLAEARTAP